MLRKLGEKAIKIAEDADDLFAVGKEGIKIGRSRFSLASKQQCGVLFDAVADGRFHQAEKTTGANRPLFGDHFLANNGMG